MVATECFNKSFVAVAQGELAVARGLLQRHFAIRGRLDAGDIDPIGLIAVANLLVAEGKFKEAAEAAFVCRRLMAAKNIVPDPADEAPLKAVEKQCVDVVPEDVLMEIHSKSLNKSCQEMVGH